MFFSLNWTLTVLFFDKILEISRQVFIDMATLLLIAILHLIRLSLFLSITHSSGASHGHPRDELCENRNQLKAKNTKIIINKGNLPLYLTLDLLWPIIQLPYICKS